VAIQYSATDGFNNNVLTNGHDIGVLGTNTITVTLPVGKVSNNAIIQWIWATVADGGYYLGCSDVQIVASGNPAAPTCASKVGNTVFAAPAGGLIVPVDNTGTNSQSAAPKATVQQVPAGAERLYPLMAAFIFLMAMVF
jgi:hypothetical protein